MEVTGKNLLNVCKLLFSLARTDANDRFFSEEAIAGEGGRGREDDSFLNIISAPLLGLLSTCDAVSDSEVLVYGVGTVKLLASNSDLRVQLIESDVLPFLSSLLEHYSQQQVRHSHSLNNKCRYFEFKFCQSVEKDVQNVLVQVLHTLHSLL